MPNSMKRYCLRLAMMMVLVAAFSGCISSEPTVYPPEPLPEMLVTLPRQAKVLCLGDSPPDKGAVVLWSLPGKATPDANSGVSGYRGDQLTSMEHCEPIQLTQYYWDPYGADYWVKIEYNEIVGWVRLDLVSVE